MFGPCRYVIVDVIGKSGSLGVENLRGSGMIAGEASLAYEEIVTISMVRSLLVSSFSFSSLFVCVCVCIHVVHVHIEVRGQHQGPSPITFHISGNRESH